MNDLRSIADRKIASERQKLIAALPDAIAAVKGAQTLNGTLHSGNTAAMIRDRCVESMSALGTEITKEYKWAANTAVFLSKSFADELTAAAGSEMEPLHEFSVAQITQQLTVLQMADLLQAFVPSLNERRAAILEEVRIELDRTFAERRRSLMRNVTVGVGSIVRKAIGT